MSHVLSSPVHMDTVHPLTDQNLNRPARETKMLLSIELSRERIRDMERRIADRHRTIDHRRSRRSMIAAARRLGHVLSNR